MKSSFRRQRGVTIIELLVVVGIIGIMLLVAAPNFFTYYRSNQIRTTMRQFNSDIRSARQRAVTKNRQVRVDFAVGATSRGYRIFEWNTDSDDWDLVASRELQPIVHFESTGFADETADSRPDIIFLSNGTIFPFPSSNAEVVLLANANVPKNQWTISFNQSGNVAAVSN